MRRPLLTMVVVAAALVPRAAPRAQVFSAKTIGVRVDALVTVNGVPVAGLKADDFELRDNGVVQTVDSLDAGDMPLNVVLALDASASTAGKRLADLRTATRTLLDDLKPVDRAALTTFNHAVAPRVPLTADLGAIRSEVDRLTASGATSLLEGMYAAVVATLGEPGRSLVIVCTDGRDTASWLQADDVIEGAKHSNAVIYVVASAGARTWAPLKSLTDVTGGRMIEIESSAQIGAEFKKILEDFRSRYVLTFTPTGVPRGGYHRLDVRIRRGGGLKVTARPGYVGESAGK
ncbi:MAG TPA: VWA domain-containing protein [Vicinamibacterales bacterium]|nr:VWA domain-containing protein [Vicinamibacterales bacterium]